MKIKDLFLMTGTMCLCVAVCYAIIIVVAVGFMNINAACAMTHLATMSMACFIFGLLCLGIGGVTKR